ncbi:MAG: ANTAR domain-containing response regulator [Candidatus Fimenecus sp.]
MRDLIIGSRHREKAELVSAVLRSEGLSVSGIYGTGAEILQKKTTLHKPIIICGNLKDNITAAELCDLMPNDTDIIALKSSGLCQSFKSSIITLYFPVRRAELVSTVKNLLDIREVKRTERTENENALISKAKKILMDKKRISERDAYAFIRKTAMDNKVKLEIICKNIITEKEKE